MPERASLADFRILIVDDQRTNLEALAMVLELSGYKQVRCLDDSRLILSVFGEFQPDLILLDLHMPHVDGLAALEQLATVIPSGDYLPVLMLTGDATSEAREKALSRGAHDFLAKPLNRAEVRLRVGNLLETRRLHLQLRARNESLERANRAKSEFLSRMSHELRTPLNSILGFAQLLALSELTPLHQENVQHILKGGYHLLELINEVLDLARIDAGRLGLSIEPVRVEQAIAECLNLVRPLAAARNITFRAELAEAGALDVLADRQRLKQVLLNLLSNAIKFNRDDGLVALTCRRSGSDRVLIEVADTGPGIDDNGLRKIFTPFERLNADQNAIAGTGLGLSLSKRMIEAMGGSIGVTSEPGAGSRFHFELALSERPSAVKQDEDLATSSDPRRDKSIAGTVLYVEDNPANLRLMAEIMARCARIHFLEAPRGELGLALARTHQPDWILLDLHLPDMRGEEVLRDLKRDPRTAAIPVTILSADATAGHSDHLRGLGAREYLAKPIDVRQVMELLESTLGNRERPRARESAEAQTVPVWRWNPENMALTDLPEEVIEQMRIAVRDGKKARLDELIAGVAARQLPCAAALKELADNYEYDALTSLLRGNRLETSRSGA